MNGWVKVRSRPHVMRTTFGIFRARRTVKTGYYLYTRVQVNVYKRNAQLDYWDGRNIYIYTRIMYRNTYLFYINATTQRYTVLHELCMGGAHT